MNEFMGRVTYPFRFSASFILVSAARCTHPSISLSGTSMSLVSTESGAVNLGIFERSSLLDFLSFFDFAAGDFDTRDLLVLNGESVRLVERPLRVRTPSLSVADRGVGGLLLYERPSSWKRLSFCDKVSHDYMGVDMPEAHINAQSFGIFFIRRELFRGGHSIVMRNGIKAIVIIRRRALRFDGRGSHHR